MTTLDLSSANLYQGRAMRIRCLASSVLLIASTLVAQTPARTAPSIPKMDPSSPANAGRAQLTRYLDDIAASQLAARRIAVASIHTRQQAEARQREVRASILKLIGGLPQRTPLHAKSLGVTQADGYRIEKILYESQPNFPVTALLYLPEAQPAGQGSRLPAIVMAPGHGPSGKASDFAFARTFARNGFAVLSYDPIGQGERLQYPDPAHPGQSLATRPTGEHGEAGLQPTLIGDALARYFAWDGIRAVDYLQSRPEIDPNRIGAFGCSGGGAMTALLGALDPRVQAIGTACYITSFDTLLPSIGPQDSEQSTPDFIASGLDFPDWVELAAPRPYAIISTASDMFPYAGARTSAAEARRFYALFDPASAGSSTGAQEPGIPTGPNLNPDTSNSVPLNAALQFIVGIGGHGNLRPLQSQIVQFFLTHLAHSSAAPILPPPPAPGASPFALPPGIPASAFQVTPTGQVLTSYPNSATVHTLNLKHADELIARAPRIKHLTLADTQRQVREVTHATAQPGAFRAIVHDAADYLESGGVTHMNLYFPSEPGIGFGVHLDYPTTPGRHPAVVFVGDPVDPSADRLAPAEQAELQQIQRASAAGEVVLAITPRPSPPGTEETKSPILGPYYLTELRAELVGKTLLGMRVDDVIRAIDYLASRPDVDPNNITAQASGHLGLVLLHAAVLDPRLKHITVDHALQSYQSLLEAPMPIGAPEDILPGVYLHYDIGDLLHALGPRLTFTDPLPGTADLSAIPAK
jgi:cephalosporin-C deacetylase-like acetyl esterase